MPEHATRRIGEWDVTDRFATLAPPTVIQTVFGVACFLALVATRSVVSLLVADAGPFALIYPAILISTLFGRARSGLVTFVLSITYVWYYLLPPTGSFAFANTNDFPRLIVNIFGCGITLVFAEVFRAAVRRAAGERHREIDERELLLMEIDHRMKNNFAIVHGLLEMQARQESEAPAKTALSKAAARVQSFAGAHRALYSDGTGATTVEMREYLGSLTDYLADALFLRDAVTIEFTADPMDMARDEAVAVGLVLNEVVTNAAKHAFGPGQKGRIAVTFLTRPDGWSLTVADDGRGAGSVQKTGGGLGSKLITAFAERAGGVVCTSRSDAGTTVVVSRGDDT